MISINPNIDELLKEGDTLASYFGSISYSQIFELIPK